MTLLALRVKWYCFDHRVLGLEFFNGSFAKNRITEPPANAKAPTVKPNAWKPTSGLTKLLRTIPATFMPVAVPTPLNAEESDIVVPLK